MTYAYLWLGFRFGENGKARDKQQKAKGAVAPARLPEPPSRLPVKPPMYVY
jgi:hypothetical protein